MPDPRPEVQPEPAPRASVGSFMPFSGLHDWRFRLLFAVGSSAWLLGILGSFLATGPDPWRLSLGVAGWALFPAGVGAIFATANRTDAFRAGAGIALVVVLSAVAMAMVLLLHIGGYVQLFFFPAFAAARLYPDRLAIGGVAIVAGTAGAVGLAAGGEPGSSLGLAVAIFFIAFTVYSVGVLQRANLALRAARHELAAMAVAAERDRFARDLHDTLGHSLTVMALKSELAGRLVHDDPARAAGEMSDVAAAARASLTSVRETVSGVRQPTVEHELRAVEAALASAEIACRVEGDVPGLDASSSGVLGWALREGVTNVIRHSGATSVRIRFASTDGAVTMELLDDGRAASREGAAGAPGAPRGFGLRGLAERVADAGGRMESGPLQPAGFRLMVSLPAMAPT